MLARGKCGLNTRKLPPEEKTPGLLLAAMLNGAAAPHRVLNKYSNENFTGGSNGMFNKLRKVYSQNKHIKFKIKPTSK